MPLTVHGTSRHASRSSQRLLFPATAMVFRLLDALIGAWPPTCFVRKSNFTSYQALQALPPVASPGCLSNVERLLLCALPTPTASLRPRGFAIKRLTGPGVSQPYRTLPYLAYHAARPRFSASPPGLVSTFARQSVSAPHHPRRLPEGGWRQQGPKLVL
jgi:hypothetical protein